MKQPSPPAAKPSKAPTAPTLLQQSPPGADTPLTHAQEELLEELSPSTPIAVSIARDIIMVDGELALLPKRRNTILWQSAITPMFDLLRRSEGCDDKQAEDLAIAWAKGCRDAEGAIISLGVDPTIAHNQAYLENILLIGNMEKQIERLERRRRQLLVDYSHLNTDGRINRTRSLGAIDDAEIVADLESGPANVS
ncbi:hypothetical protein AN191_13175 [Loktanella sp. 5RATIMAR09]|uniref:hypothetical protein n=1 Tax=Loktanella sp. 5RATIMAR09 TaxID=1225655 RepID=UPI000707B3BE|nr:hypothetical protein [Loktanella sp. 5RATIMAR09]KQI71244.1 hypothetical protein AN191_13175 [Loktanella sp. 5RATIMAR09]